MGAIRKRIRHLRIDHSTGGEGVDRPPFEQELAAETARIRRLHALLAAELAAATAQARGVLAAPTGGELSARWERDVSVHRWSERVGALTAARSGLCFGRLDHTDAVDELHRPHRAHRPRGRGERAHRLAGARRPAVLLRDAGHAARGDPAAAFPARRNGARRAGRRLSTTTCWTGRPRADSGSASDPALLAALKAPRGSTMRDIVTTIQAEQDAIIRLPLLRRRRDRGRPGDREDRGRAAPRRLPALHPPRAAGPQRRAGRRPQRRVHPLRRGRAPRAGRVGGGVHHPRPAARTASSRPPSTRTRWPRTKGGAGDAGRPAPRRRRPAGAARVADRGSSSTTSPSRSTGRRRRRPASRARATGLPHNAARTTFRDTLGSLLVEQGVERLDQDLEDPPELAELLRELGDLPEIEPASAAQLSAELRHELRDDLRSDLGFHAAVERLWPVLTPEQVLAELFASPDRLASAGGGTDLSGLHRAEGSAWTVADAPLLDELAELLGPPRPTARRATRTTRQRRQRAYAAEVLSILESADRAARRRGPRRAAPDRLRHRGRARRPAGARAPHERRRAGGRRPGLAVRASRRRRGAGALRHGLARPAAALPDPLDHRGGRPRAAQRPRGSAGVGGRARARTSVPGGPTGRSR